MQDSDGEFLLIEAADFLPKWLNPETAENRVFIHNGCLNIIPSKHTKTAASTGGTAKTGTKVEFPDTISDPQIGMELVLQYPELTLAPATIQTAIRERLAGFAFGEIESGGKSNWHRANCLLPPKIALILQRKPHLISDATRAFYLRDSFDLKACREMRHFAPPGELLGLILRPVKFSKHLFAMIQGQNFRPDKWSGWCELMAEAEKTGREKSFNLGMKVTCGFEILCTRAESIKKRKGAKSKNCLMSTADVRWPEFLKSLKRNGFFKGETDGSKLYSELMSQAKSFFESSVLSLTEDGATSHPGEEVMQFVDRDLTDADLMLLKQGNQPNDDDEGWLNVTAEQLDKMMLGGGAEGQMPNGWGSDADDEGEGEAEVGGGRGRSKQKRVGGHTSQGSSILNLHMPTGESYGEEDSSDMESYDEDQLQIDLSEEAMKEAKHFAKDMRQYMNQMDRELGRTSVGKSFANKRSSAASNRAKSKSPAADSIDLEDDDFRPVNIDKHLVTNMLESYWSESHPGPASALLRTLKLRPPRQRAELDSDDFNEDFAEVEEQEEETQKK